MFIFCLGAPKSLRRAVFDLHLISTQPYFVDYSKLMWTLCTLPKTAAKLARELILSFFHLLNYATKSAVPVPPELLFHHLIPNIQSLLAQQ